METDFGSSPLARFPKKLQGAFSRLFASKN